MILVFKYIFTGNYVGLALWPFILIKNGGLRDDRVLLNHERIHLRQQLELLILLFYVWYVLEWSYYLVKLGDGYKAYRAVSFEREAYAEEQNMDYLQKRRLWSFFRYYRKADTGTF